MTYGERARIGALVVSNDRTAEPDYALLRTPGVALYAARMLMTDTGDPLENLVRMTGSAREAAATLATLAPDVVTYSCTSASFFKGAAFEAELRESLASITGCPVVSTARSCVEALRSLNAQRIAVVTPYTDEVNDRLRLYLADADLTVTSLHGAQLTDNDATCSLPLDTIAELCAAALDESPADALFISCTAVPVLEHVDYLERRFALPVVTANQATWWAALRTAGIYDRIEGFGALLGG